MSAYKVPKGICGVSEVESCPSLASRARSRKQELAERLSGLLAQR